MFALQHQVLLMRVIPVEGSDPSTTNVSFECSDGLGVKSVLRDKSRLGLYWEALLRIPGKPFQAVAVVCQAARRLRLANHRVLCCRADCILLLQKWLHCLFTRTFLRISIPSVKKLDLFL